VPSACIAWGAQPPRLSFGAPSRRTLPIATELDVAFVILRIPTTGASSAAPGGGRAPRFRLNGVILQSVVDVPSFGEHSRLGCRSVRPRAELFPLATELDVAFVSYGYRRRGRRRQHPGRVRSPVPSRCNHCVAGAGAVKV
jgi:hypothetical protein